MNGVEYPSAIEAILDKPAFLIAVDRTVELALESHSDENVQMANLAVELTTLCMTQANLVVRSAHPDRTVISMVDMLYYVLLEADNRWSMVRDYLRDTRQLDMHPLLMISLIRNGTVGGEGKKELDDVVVAALDRYATTMKESLEEVMGIAANAPTEVKLPSIKDDPKLLEEFFIAFKSLGKIHKNRDEYRTQEEKEAFDRMMAIYEALSGL